MWEVNVKVIKPGTCTIDPGNIASPVHAALKHQLGIKGGSTVSLLREKDDFLLIDTGYEDESNGSSVNKGKNRDLLKFLLDLHGHRPEDITKVFITHFHKDHFGGIELFARAKWFCHRLAHDGLENPLKDTFIPLDEGDQIIHNAVVMHTPGHTRGHASILWSNNKRTIRVAISGDAIINLSWLQAGSIWKFNNDFSDREEARKSIQRLIDGADLIIPGHGEPFFTSGIKLIKFSQ
jgi:glyoxylase-like metal-dependent hydrolase (beta-lactamase superfamily II)